MSVPRMHQSPQPTMSAEEAVIGRIRDDNAGACGILMGLIGVYEDAIRNEIQPLSPERTLHHLRAALRDLQAAPSEPAAGPDLAAQAAAGEALYRAIYYAPGDYITRIFCATTPNAVTDAFMRAQQTFGPEVLCYLWKDPNTGEERNLSPHDVTIVRRSGP
jgi:hypothetical protein